jgi:hypothetical protein
MRTKTSTKQREAGSSRPEGQQLALDFGRRAREAEEAVQAARRREYAEFEAAWQKEIAFKAVHPVAYERWLRARRGVSLSRSPAYYEARRGRGFGR